VNNKLGTQGRALHVLLYVHIFVCASFERIMLVGDILQPTKLRIGDCIYNCDVYTARGFTIAHRSMDISQIDVDISRVCIYAISVSNAFGRHICEVTGLSMGYINSHPYSVATA
jgi:hypothetical protein